MHKLISLDRSLYNIHIVLNITLYHGNIHNYYLSIKIKEKLKISLKHLEFTLAQVQNRDLTLTMPFIKYFIYQVKLLL